MKRKNIKRSMEFKIKVVDEYKNNPSISYRELGEKYDISPNTIAQWVYKFKRGEGEKQIGNFTETNIDYKERYEILKKFIDSQK